MSWGVPRRPKISTKLSYPEPREGSDGDIQVRQTNLGAKLFGKVGGRWYGAPLTGTAGDPVTRIGTNLSNHLAIDRDSVDIFTNSTKVASFGATTTVGNFSATSAGVVTVTDLFVKNAITTEGGTSNIMIGTNNGSGRYNIGIGNDALEDCSGTVDTSNVAIGNGAGKNINTYLSNNPSGNVCIGNQAGDAIRSGSYNVAVGRDSDCSAIVDNQVAIGNTAVTGAVECIAIGSNITNSTTDTVMFGDTDDSVSSADWSSSGAIAWTATSDVRKKRNIQDSNLGLEFINKLRPVSFQFKPQNEVPEEWQHYSEINTWDIEKIHHGFIAQEVKEVLDEYDAPDSVAAWMEDKDGMQRLGETKLITPLIKAVQELSAKLDTMQTEINNLKAE